MRRLRDERTLMVQAIVSIVSLPLIGCPPPPPLLLFALQDEWGKFHFTCFKKVLTQNYWNLSHHTTTIKQEKTHRNRAKTHTIKQRIRTIVKVNTAHLLTVCGLSNMIKTASSLRNSNSCNPITTATTALTLKTIQSVS